MRHIAMPVLLSCVWGNVEGYYWAFASLSYYCSCISYLITKSINLHRGGMFAWHRPTSAPVRNIYVALAQIDVPLHPHSP